MLGSESKNPTRPVIIEMTGTPRPGFAGKSRDVPADAAAPNPAQRSPESTQSIRRGQIAGAHLLEIARIGAHYKAMVDGTPFMLTRARGEMLEALADESGPFRDRYVPWKTKTHLQRRLGIGPGALSSRIRRLREHFESLETPVLRREMVMADRKRGFRFAVEKCSRAG